MDSRPGGPGSRRPLHFYWICDCSGSMSEYGKIQALNSAIREALPHVKEAAGKRPKAQVMMRVLSFSTGAKWQTPEPVPIESFQWDDLSANGSTDMGKALTLVAKELSQFNNDGVNALPPVFVLISDGHPSDDYNGGLKSLDSEPWGSKTVRIAIAIGKDADLSELEKFTGPAIKPLRAESPEALVTYIRWGSTLAVTTGGNNLLESSRPQELLVKRYIW
jgi:uncharacterized protein YegL